MAQEIQKHVSIPIIHNLKRVKRTSQQAKLTKEKRHQNLTDAFEAKFESKITQRIILIDDVVASGATLDSAARVLKKKGAKEVVALVFARGGKR